VNEIKNEYEAKARQLVRFYARRICDSAKVTWNSDTAGDIEAIVTAMLDSMDERIKNEVARAMVGPRPTMLWTGRIIYDLEGGRTFTHGRQAIMIQYAGANANPLRIEGPEAETLWSFLCNLSVNITPTPAGADQRPTPTPTARL
jgi:hypothetical protein